MHFILDLTFFAQSYTFSIWWLEKVKTKLSQLPTKFKLKLSLTTNQHTKWIQTLSKKKEKGERHIFYVMELIQNVVVGFVTKIGIAATMTPYKINPCFG